jgi:hypothetical protein
VSTWFWGVTLGPLPLCWSWVSERQQHVYCKIHGKTNADKIKNIELRAERQLGHY